VCRCFTAKVPVSNFKVEKSKNLDNAFYVFYVFWYDTSKNVKKVAFFGFWKTWKTYYRTMVNNKHKTIKEESTWEVPEMFLSFLADRTNGRAYMLHCCVRLSVICDICIVAKRCVLQKSCFKKQAGNDCGNRMVTWSMTSHDPKRSRSWPQYAYGSISRKRLETDSWLQMTVTLNLSTSPCSKLLVRFRSTYSSVLPPSPYIWMKTLLSVPAPRTLPVQTVISYGIPVAHAEYGFKVKSSLFFSIAE